MGNWVLCCCYGTFFGRGEEKPLIIGHPGSELIDMDKKNSSRRKSSKKLDKKQRKEIRIIWANNPKTNSVFTKLGAVDIVHRYDKLLSEWKLLKDSEKEFKELMALDHDKALVQCMDSIPPEMRIGFSHGINEEYEFHLAVDPLVSIEKLNASLTRQLQRSIHLFSMISSQMNTIKVEGSHIERDLSVLVSLFKDDKQTSVEIQGVHHNIELLSLEQVKQALLILKDIIRLTSAQSTAIMDYIVEQGSNVDLHVVKDNPDNPKVIIFSKKYGDSKQRKSRIAVQKERKITS